MTYPMHSKGRDYFTRPDTLTPRMSSAHLGPLIDRTRPPLLARLARRMCILPNPQRR